MVKSDIYIYIYIYGLWIYNLVMCVDSRMGSVAPYFLACKQGSPNQRSRKTSVLLFVLLRVLIFRMYIVFDNQEELRLLPLGVHSPVASKGSLLALCQDLLFNVLQ